MRTTNRRDRATLALGIAILAWGCASNDGPASNEPLHQPSVDPRGVYVDDFGISQRIDADGWTILSDVFTFVELNSEDDYAVALNSETNEFSPGAFSRFDWATDEAGQLRYCQTKYDAKTAAEAASALRADESDWAEGCAGFPWSVLAGPSIVGSYEDGWGGKHSISGEIWAITGEGTSSFNLLILSNEDRYLIARNGTTNDYFAGKFSRFDWTGDANGSLFYCQTVYDAETAAAALAAPAADATDLAKGCAGFAWSVLTREAL